MARTALAVQPITRAGVVPAYTAANAQGHAVANSERTFLHVKVGATPTNVTIQTPGTIDGLAIADSVVAMLANSEKMFGPYPASIYTQPDDSPNFWVDFSSVATVTIAALSV